MPYIKNSQIWTCPSHSGQFDPNDADHYDQAGGYGIACPGIAETGRGAALGAIEFPSDTVWFGDCRDSWLDSGSYGGHIDARHNGTANVSFRGWAGQGHDEECSRRTDPRHPVV